VRSHLLWFSSLDSDNHLTLFVLLLYWEREEEVRRAPFDLIELTSQLLLDLYQTGGVCILSKRPVREVQNTRKLNMTRP
jgi:hypothetical protein